MTRLLFLPLPQTAKSEGRPCEYNSRIYQNGESFQPNCKHQCTCIDGAVGCIPLCPEELSLPTLGCANPRLVKVPGQCCEEWVCDDSGLLEPSEKQFGKEPMPDETESDLTNRNELVANVKAGLKSLPGRCLCEFSFPAQWAGSSWLGCLIEWNLNCLPSFCLQRSESRLSLACSGARSA